MENRFTTVIIGGGLTGLSTAYNLSSKGERCALVEREERFGGQIKSIQKEGFTFECGPNTGTVSNKYVVDLFEDLDKREGLCRLQLGREESKRRLIYKGDRFHDLPSGLIGGVRTPLFRFSDKLRILGEPFRKRSTDEMESVGALAARRLGRSFVDYAVDPFIGGIYAGDPWKLVTKYAMPKLYNLEHEYGSFIKGSIKRGKIIKAEREAGISKEIFSVEGGLSSLVETLENRVRKSGVEMYSGCGAVVEKDQESGEWRVRVGDRELICQRVITTTPGYELPEILPFVDRKLMSDIISLKYAGIIQVSLCYDSLPSEVLSGAVDSFGALIPYKEGSQVLGILFPSSCFEGRAVDGGAVLSVFTGGVRHSEVLEMSDREVEVMVLGEVEKRLGITDRPKVVSISRHSRAIPQYEASTRERLVAIEAIEGRYKGLELRGNIRDGIGMADRIKQGMSVSRL